MRILRVIPIVLLLATAVRAGIIVTTDGETFTGDLKRTDEGWTITQDDGQVKTVTTRQVKSIGLESSVRPDRAAAGLRSLQRSVEFSDDLPKIIQRYRTFIEQSKDTSVTAKANEDLKIWTSRQEQGLVKVGRRWITPAERDALTLQWRQAAEQARLLMKEARDREAAKLIADTLEQDPQNSSALYLRGVLAQKRQETGEAKKAFLAVQQVLPEHAPTLLNLSIILSRQKQWPAACVAMEQSLLSAPVTQVLLDTAAELLNLLPPEQRRGPAAQKLFRSFMDQDTRLQKVMAARKLFRWGSMWIDQTEHDRIAKASDAVQKRLAELQKDFDAAQARLTSLDTQINQNAQAMRSIESHSYMTAADGTRVRVPLPSTWYELQSDNAKLAAEKTETESKFESLRSSAREVQITLPVPSYTGQLLPIEEDGVPLAIIAKASTSAPATAEPTSKPSSVIRVGPPDSIP